MLLIFPTVILNGVSLVTISKCSQLREKISYFLIMMQSATDLGVGLVSLPALCATLVMRTTESRNCLAELLLENIAAFPTLLSVVNLTAMTLERYIGVLHPFKHRTLVTKKRLLVCYFFGAFFMFSIVALPIFGIDSIGALLSASLLVFLFLAAFVYTKIFMTIRNRTRLENGRSLNASAVEQSVSRGQKNMKFLKEMKLIKSCFLAVICFLICFLPGIVVLFLGGGNFEWKFFSTAILMLNSCINCIIFFWTRPLLRNESVKTFKAFCCF